LRSLSIQIRPGTVLEMLDNLLYSIPDISAICTPEVELPTLSLDSGQLSNVSLMDPVATIHLDPLHSLYSVDRSNSDPVLDLSSLQSLNTGMDVNLKSVVKKPYLKIIEQPKSNTLRFRYQCEGRGAGALQGERSTPEKKTFPKIQIVGYKGPAVVVVSCVTHDSEVPKTHPHNLVSPASVGREGCKKGVCTIYVNNEDMSVEFPHLGIQCVRKKDVDQSLKVRKEIRVDPYRAGFSHCESPGSIDLNAVRLCFQAFLESPSHPGKYNVVLPPVSSNTVYDAKAKKELQIMDISDISSPMEGGKKIIILCEKVTREDIKVRFYDQEAGWEGWGVFGPNDVHKQYAISLVTPAYNGPNSALHRRVLVELVKPSDDTNSEPTEFFYVNSNNMTGLHMNQHNHFVKENSFESQRGIQLPESVSQIKVERKERIENNKQNINYNMGVMEEPLINCYDNYTSPQAMDNLITLDKAVDNLSGKIETFSLSDAIETSLSMESDVYNILVPKRGSIKRCSKTAALESGPDLSPRQASIF